MKEGISECLQIFHLIYNDFITDDLEIVSIEENSHEIRLHMLSRSKSFCCPGCSEELHKLHATHHRTVQVDIPQWRSHPIS